MSSSNALAAARSAMDATTLSRLGPTLHAKTWKWTFSHARRANMSRDTWQANNFAMLLLRPPFVETDEEETKAEHRVFTAEGSFVP